MASAVLNCAVELNLAGQDREAPPLRTGGLGWRQRAGQRSLRSQGLHRHLLSGCGSRGSCAAGLGAGRVPPAAGGKERRDRGAQVERGRGAGRAGPAPGVGPGGAGGAGPRYANVAHGRPIAGAPRAAWSAPSRRRPRDQREGASGHRGSSRSAAQRRARGAWSSGAAAGPRSSTRASTAQHSAAGPSPAPRSPAQRPAAPRPAPRAGVCALGAPASGRPQPTRGEAAPSAPEPSHGPGWGPGPRLLTRPNP
ncbi:translation initiation factor IF-2 [Erinaceus europaeus]|uniref:Translation initiation factor IF-2 n=1 Tax=Erinaceus europaeus TaxID=9365 RepID=A0ABM3YIK2_ERIEU|nr:translation initiation factor IF-2 [Erinaceus europaeus]